MTGGSGPCRILRSQHVVRVPDVSVSSQQLICSGGCTIYNRVTLIGTIADRPQEMYDTDANRYVYMSLKVARPLMLHQRTGEASTICKMLSGQKKQRLTDRNVL